MPLNKGHRRILKSTGLALFGPANALHKELVSSGRLTNRAFHDALYWEGNMPI